MFYRTRWPASVCVLVIAVLAVTTTLRTPAEDSSDKKDATKKDGTSREELEKKFTETLFNATLAGKFRLVRKGEIGPESTERYTLGAVKKLSGDRWLIEARIQYGEKDFRMPVPVDVKWAGDTPVIQVTDWGIPALGIGPYTARVMIYDGLYTGAWFGKGYGGLMSGEVVPPEKSAEGEKDGGDAKSAGGKANEDKGE